MKKNTQYDGVAKEYESVAKTDPSKQFVQQPGALKLIGDIEGRDILDVGCGDGTFTRKLAMAGAKVVGYDISKEQIAIARQREKENPLGINYFVSDQYKFNSKNKFDKAMANMVLFYAENLEQLERFFESIFINLKDKGIFVSILVNPEFKRFNEIRYLRRWTRVSEEKLKVEFLDENGNVKMSAIFSDFSKAQYEKAAKKAGFKIVKWEKLGIDKDGIRILGKEFWEGYKNYCPYIGLVVTK